MRDASVQGRPGGYPFEKAPLPRAPGPALRNSPPAGLRQSSLVSGPGTRVKTLQIFRKGIPQACLQAAAAHHTNYATPHVVVCFLDAQLKVKGRPPSLPSILQIRSDAHCNRSGPGWVIRARSCAHKPRSPKRGRVNRARRGRPCTKPAKAQHLIGQVWLLVRDASEQGRPGGYPFEKAPLPHAPGPALRNSPLRGSDSPRLFPVRARGSKRSKFFERVSPRPAFKLQLRTTQTTLGCLDAQLKVKGRPPSLPVILQISPDAHRNQSGPGWVIRARSCAHKPRSPKRGRENRA